MISGIFWNSSCSSFLAANLSVCRESVNHNLTDAHRKLVPKEYFELLFGTVHRTCVLIRCFIAFFLPVLAAAVRVPAQPSVTPSPDTQLDSATHPDFSAEPAIYEFLHATMRYEDDGSGSREVRGRIRVQTSAGLPTAGQLVFEYNAVDEKVEIRSVRVLKPDGSVVAAGPDAVQDLNAPKTSEAPMYTDARQKHVTVPGLSVGDAVEYNIFVTSKPLLPGQFWQIWNFERRIVALDEQLDLNVPANRVLKIKSSQGIETSTHLEGDRRLYHYSTSNLKTPPPIDIFKDFKFDVIQLLQGPRPPPPPRVMFSTFQDWTSIADWYAQLERDRRIPTAEIRTQADEIARGRQSDEDKAAALYYWVSQNIRYVSLSFGVGRYQPHSAAEVLANRYGDCKDKTTLLEAMLEAEGLRAQPVLANLVADIDPEIPNPLQFDHVITFLPLGSKESWLDTTLSVGPFGYLPPQLRGKQVLLVYAIPSSALRKTPQDFPFTVEYRIGVDGTVDGLGTMDATVELQTRGDLEVLIRILNAHLSQEQLAKTADTVLARTNKFLYESVHYTDFKVVNAADVSQPVRAQFHLAGRLMYVDPKGSTPDQLAVSLTSKPIDAWHLLTLLPAANSTPDSAGRPQQLPIELNGPRSYSFKLNLAFATLSGTARPPAKEFRITQTFAEYASSDSWKGNTFRAYRALELRVPTISSSDSKDYAVFVQKIVGATGVPPTPKRESKMTDASLATVTTSSKSDAPARMPGVDTKANSPSTKNDGGAIASSLSPSVSSPSEAEPLPAPHVLSPETRDIYKRGEEEAKRKNWANAIEAFSSAVKADPQYADAWRELGRAHMYIRNYVDAEVAFRKYLALAPDDHLAYLNMAWVLYSERNYSEEVTLLTKRLADSPNDGDANARLGSAYLALDHPELALPVLQTAVSIFPKYEFPQFNLARAHLQMHHYDAAAAEFQRAIQIDGSSHVLNSAAYALAQANTHLEIAASWSERAIQAEEVELDQAKLPLQAETLRRVGSLAAYWDTMGWIRFQQGNLETAEKYIWAAADLASDTTILFHLGRIYEAQGRKNEAIGTYAEALASVPVARPIGSDEKETRIRLGVLLGDVSLVDDRIKLSLSKLRERRSVSIPNPGGLEGITQYSLILGRASKVIEIEALTPDDPLAGLKDTIRSVTMLQSFPDETIQRLPRAGTLSCPRAELPCTFTFTPAGSVSRVVAPD